MVIKQEVIQSKTTLDELFENINGAYELTDELREWEEMKPVGNEIISQ